MDDTLNIQTLSIIIVLMGEVQDRTQSVYGFSSFVTKIIENSKLGLET